MAQPSLVNAIYRLRQPHRVTPNSKSDNALVWSGTAASAVDLNPTLLANFTDSEALAADGSQQVGYGYDATGFGDRALLWLGTSDSAVDLNPAGLSTSMALDTNGLQQVGKAGTDAFLWSGTAESGINLALLLPADGTWSRSIAYSIDDAGNIYGNAIGTFDGVYGTYAVEWSPVPEPGSFTLLAAGAAGLLVRCRRKPICAEAGVQENSLALRRSNAKM